MSLDPTPELLENLYWITLLVVIVSSASGVLKAGFKLFDLFGLIIMAIATGLVGIVRVTRYSVATLMDEENV